MEGWHWQDFKTLGLQASTVRARVSHQASEYIFTFVPWGHYETDGRRVGLKTQTPYLAFDTHGVFRQPQRPISSSQARNAQGIWSEGHTPSYSGPQHYHSMGFDWTPFAWNTSQYDSAPCCPLKRGSRFAGLEPTWRRYSPPKLSAKPGRCRWRHCHIAAIVPWRYTSPTHIVADPKDLAEGLGYGIAGFEATRWKRFRMWIYNDL